MANLLAIFDFFCVSTQFIKFEYGKWHFLLSVGSSFVDGWFCKFYVMIETNLDVFHLDFSEL